jgi:pilus assembly protein CpaD
MQTVKTMIEGRRSVAGLAVRAAADAMHEIVSILAASGMPPQSIVVQTYVAATGPSPAPIRISYPQIKAQVGPCGLWPQDIGPSFNRDYFENQPPWNYGCATQNALAVEVANPSDLVQPRPETAPYTERRITVLQKYTSGQNTSSEESSGANAAKISDVGK